MRHAFPNYGTGKTLCTLLCHYCYLGVWTSELVWMSFASSKMLEKRMHFDKSIEPLLEQVRDGKHVLVESSHYANWEMALLRTSMIDPNIALHFSYRPLHNLFFDRYIKYIRTRFGGRPMPEKTVLHRLGTIKRRQQGGITLTLVDHTPKRVQPKHWVSFLGGEIALTGGPYQLPKILGATAYYMIIERAHLLAPYLVKLVKLGDAPNSQADRVRMLHDYVHQIEKLVHKNPCMWMWTLSRDKYSRGTGKYPRKKGT